MKTSTSRDSSIKHSTGKDETTSKKTRHRRPPTSTGKTAAIVHFRGNSFEPEGEETAHEDKMTKHKPPKAA